MIMFKSTQNVYHKFNYFSLRLSSTMSCLFCDIIKDNDKNKIVFEDEKVVVFPDIKPASKHHYLVVPKEHILNAKVLSPEQKPLVEHMFTIGKNILQDKGENLMNARFGFHWPPCYSIGHLHLHVISPVQDMSFISRMIFKDNSYWFVPPQYVIDSLSK